MIAFLILFLHVLVSPFRTRARLEAEIIVLRHQLNVLRRRVPSKPKLTIADRLLFVWLYRLFPSVLERRHNCPAGHHHPMAPGWLPPVLALEITISRRSAEGSVGDPLPDSRHEFSQPTMPRSAH